MGRLEEVEGDSWLEIGSSLALRVADKSSFAYRFDREIYSDESDILDLWKRCLAPHAKKSMMNLSPNAFDLCVGFDSVFSVKGPGYSVWELLTLYEVDMFLHEFHYKCRYCSHRIMRGPRYICAAIDAHPKKAEKGSDPEHKSVCSDCIGEHPTCAECRCKLEPTHVLHETSGLGIANKSGCTGFGYRDDKTYFCGQTLEMATDTYNYGRFDTVYKLRNKSTDVSALVYDVGCILSPFGVNSKQLGLCVFNLYNSDYALPPYSEDRVPMAALQWEILLRGSTSVPDAFSYLAEERIKTFTSASFIIAADGESSVVEVSANSQWVPGLGDDLHDDQPPAIRKGTNLGARWVVRANNCLAGSSLRDLESLPPNISSRDRQQNLEESFNSSETPLIDPAWAKAALSTPTIQTEYCLGTIVMEPLLMQIHVRFRAGTRISSTIRNGGKWEVFKI